MSDKSPKDPDTAALIEEMRAGIITIAGQRQASDTIDSMLARAARKAGLSFRQAKAFYHRETLSPRGVDVDKIRKLVPRTDISGHLEELEQLRAENALLRNLICKAIADASSRPVPQEGRTQAGESRGAVARLVGPGPQVRALA